MVNCNLVADCICAPNMRFISHPFNICNVVVSLSFCIHFLYKLSDGPNDFELKQLNDIYIMLLLYTFRAIVDFPKFLGIAMETFLTLCDDAESDVRMVADECLNRSIKASNLCH